MSDMYLKTADVVIIEREATSLSTRISSITQIIKDINECGRTEELRKYIANIEVTIDDDAIGTDVKASILNGEVLLINDLNPDIVETDVNEFTYGVVIECNGYPFVAYPDGPTLLFEPYTSLKVKNVYRHYITENEIQKSQMIYNFVMPDLTASMSGIPCNVDIANKFPGNIGLNYIFIVFGFLGMDYPEEWALSGAPRALIEDFTYGFRKVIV